jgi:hypothetical protein
MPKKPKEEISPFLSSFPKTFKGSQDLYMAIGHGISEWSKIEERLVYITAKLLGTKIRKAGLVMYSIMNFHVWINLIDDLFKTEQIYPQAHERWRKAFKPLKRANDTRVRLAHNALVLDVLPLLEKSGPIKATLRPSRLDQRPKTKGHVPLTAAEIWSFADVVKELCSELDEVLAWMKKRRPSR